MNAPRQPRIKPIYPDDPSSLRPQKPHLTKEGTSSAFRTLLHQAKAINKAGKPHWTPKACMQRCVVRVSFTSPRDRATKQPSPGKWAAHGKYIAREEASAMSVKQAGFSATEDIVDCNIRLHAWQEAGDPRLYKVMLTPEHGKEIDLRTFARNVMADMAITMDTNLEWVATAHTQQWNREHTARGLHPHVHIALRGVDQAGKALPRPLPREAVLGLRRTAIKLLTRELGYRKPYEKSFVIEPSMRPKLSI